MHSGHFRKVVEWGKIVEDDTKMVDTKMVEREHLAGSLALCVKANTEASKEHFF